MEIKHDVKKNATFLPSISNMYVATLANDNVNRIIKCLGSTIEEIKESLNHLKSTGIFFYPYALYSAGHAKEYAEDKCMITKRDKNTFILGDSGGYQFGTGANDYPWDNKEKQKQVQLETMQWLENNCDAAMTLDLPPWIATRNKKAMKAGLVSYASCRDATLETLETFITNRTPGKVEFLNVLQGETEENWNDWYEHVIKFSDKKIYGDRAFEGFAFAGRQSYCMYAILKTSLKLLNEGRLDHGPVMHFLGSGKLNSATAFSRLQEMLQKRTGSDIMITFDAASPYLSAASGKVYSDISINTDEVTFKYRSLPGTTIMVLPGHEDEVLGKIIHGTASVPPKDGKPGKPGRSNKASKFDLVEAGRIYQGLPKAGPTDEGIFFPGGKNCEKPVWLRDKGGNSSGAMIQDKNGERKELFWTNSPIVKNIKNKDIYTLRTKTISGKVEKLDENGNVIIKKGKPVMESAIIDKYSVVQIDSLAYVVAMAHNVYMHIIGIEQMNEIFNNGDWHKLPKKYKKMDDIIKYVFTHSTKEALEHIEENKDFLLGFTGKGRKQQAITTTETAFSSLFVKKER